jgi:hypothetical protein
MFLDADTIPLVNLDYLFHLSDPALHPHPILRPNLIMATRAEPCNTGMFIMNPEEGAWDELQGVIQRHHELAKNLPYPHFDFVAGWGHNFEKEGDVWEAIHRNGTRWRFHAGHSDQGLWYYFTKYFKQDVSIVIGNRLQNISPGQDGKPQKENLIGVLSKYAPNPIAIQDDCKFNPSGSHSCNPVYQDFAHFMGSNKPWMRPPCKECQDSHSLLTQPHNLWYTELTELNEKYSMGLDMEHFVEKHMPHMEVSPLGYIAKYWDHKHIVMSHGKKSDDRMDTTIASALSPSLLTKPQSVVSSSHIPLALTTPRNKSDPLVRSPLDSTLHAIAPNPAIAVQPRHF